MSAERLREDWPYAAVMIAALRKHPDLTASSIQLFFEVYSELDSPRTQSQLVKTTGMSRQSVIRATRQLHDRGLIQYERERLRPVNLIKDL